MWVWKSRKNLLLKFRRKNLKMTCLGTWSSLLVTGVGGTTFMLRLNVIEFVQYLGAKMVKADLVLYMNFVVIPKIQVRGKTFCRILHMRNMPINCNWFKLEVTRGKRSEIFACAHHQYLQCMYSWTSSRTPIAAVVVYKIDRALLFQNWKNWVSEAFEIMISELKRKTCVRKRHNGVCFHWCFGI